MKKTESVFLFAVALLAMPAAFAQAPAYPAKPLKLVVPFSPGGASDLTARTLAQKMGESLGQPIVVENKPGVNGALGIDSVAKSQPDGYTILLADRGSLTVNPSLYLKLPYDPIKDLSSIGIATDGPYVLVANPKLNVTTVKELVALSKSRPGTVNYSSFGIGSMAHLNLEAFNQRMGTDMLHVPYKGASA
jgi:tripartite-type tricarboxylate transporter receptor subunit TctC